MSTARLTPHHQARSATGRSSVTPALTKVVRVIVAGLVLSSAYAADDVCISTRNVTATGYSASEAIGAIATQQGLAQALAAAITQANGTLIRHQTSLETTITTAVTGARLTSRTDEEFSELLEQTTAGVIQSYQVIGQGEEHGLATVTVSADVCIDPRAALSFTGDATASASLEAGMLSLLQQSGWRIGSVNGLRSSQAIDAYLRTGATVLLTIDNRPSRFGTYRSLTTVQLMVTATMTDLRSEELNQSHALIVEGLGSTQHTAIQDAATKAALELAAIFQDTWTTADTSGPTRIIFTNVLRPSTRFEVQDLLDTTPGLTLTTDLSWDPATAVLTAYATLHGDSCQLGERLTGARRLLIRLDSCTPQSLILRIQRE